MFEHLPTYLPICTVPSNAFTSAAASGNKQVAMDMLLSDERANVNAHDNKGWTCLHWTGNCGMTRLAELLLCRADSHIDVLDDNGNNPGGEEERRVCRHGDAWSWT